MSPLWLALLLLAAAHNGCSAESVSIATSPKDLEEADVTAAQLEKGVVLYANRPTSFDVSARELQAGCDTTAANGFYTGATPDLSSILCLTLLVPDLTAGTGVANLEIALSAASYNL